MTVSTLPLGSPYRYIPSVGANAAFAALWGLWFVISLVYIYWQTARGARWGRSLPVGMFFSALGFVIRVASTGSVGAMKSIPAYAVQNLFIILSPCAMLAFNYVTFGRLIVAVDPSLRAEAHGAAGTGKLRKRTRSRYSLLPPRLFGRVFVWSDVITFLVQATGGGCQAVGGATGRVGDKIFLAGVTLQAASYLAFLGLVIYSHAQLARESARYSLSYILSSHPACRVLFGIYASSIFYIIRSFYRIVEMAEGYEGLLMSKEVYVIALDTCPLLIATGLWLLNWPARPLQQLADGDDDAGRSTSIASLGTHADMADKVGVTQAQRHGASIDAHEQHAYALLPR